MQPLVEEDALESADMAGGGAWGGAIVEESGMDEVDANLEMFRSPTIVAEDEGTLARQIQSTSSVPPSRPSSMPSETAPLSMPSTITEAAPLSMPSTAQPNSTADVPLTSETGPRTNGRETTPPPTDSPSVSTTAIIPLSNEESVITSLEEGEEVIPAAAVSSATRVTSDGGSPPTSPCPSPIPDDLDLNVSLTESNPRIQAYFWRCPILGCPH